MANFEFSPVNIRRRPIDIGRVKPAERVKPKGSDTAQGTTKKTNFQEILKQVIEQEQVKFSNHALLRLSQRNINLTLQDVNKLKQAVNLAEKKGVKDTLILMNTQSRREVAFVVNVPNRTVVTALERDEAQSHTFTNIDAALIL